MEERTYNTQMLVDGEALGQYAELKKNLNKEYDNFNYIIEHMPPTYSNTDAYIKDYVKRLTPDELKKRADVLIRTQNLKENNGLLEHMSEKNIGNFNHFRNQWSPIMWQAHEKENTQTIKIGNKIVNAGDLNFSIAETMELQDSGRDPVTEYHDWIKAQSNIENNIYANGTTCDEIAQRNFFIEFMESRETEIKRIADLYSASALNPNSPVQKLAQEKLKFTLFRLSELRRLRDRMKSTKSIPDKCKHKEEREKMELERQAREAYYRESYTTSLGENRLTNDNKDICNNNITFRPDTKKPQEAEEKMLTAKNNGIRMIEKLQALRGLGPMERSNLSLSKQPINVKSLRCFDMAAYNQALRELNK